MRNTAKTGKRSSFLYRVLTSFSCAWLACVCLEPRAARAEDNPRPPADVLGTRVAPLELPALPKSFVEERVGHVRWAYHPSATEVVQKLERELPALYRRITRELGAEEEASSGSEIVIRIARGPEDMRALTPHAAPPPSYAVGVAYPALGLVVLSVVNPQSWLPPDLSSVLTHELSHIALQRAVDGRPLPLWFVEGMAVHQAGEQNLQRVQTLWEAAAVDEVLPLSALSRNFPARAHEVNRAYAQSADLVEHLLRNNSDRERLPELLRRVAEGMSFEDAILTAYHIDLAYLDREWRQALGERFRVLPLVLTGTALWGGIAVLAVLAFVRRRRDHHAKLARWAEEEAAHERALQTLELTRQAALREEVLRESNVVPSLPRDSGIPTIDYEGQRHTLH
ncbi:MAG: peptidase MA family metallohydrolase [Myxococcales bacterium]